MAALFRKVKILPPAETVTVRGIVKEIWPYPDYIYGELFDFDREAAITFRCPVDHAPKRGEAAVLRGELKVRLSRGRWYYNLRLEGIALYGAPTGAGLPAETLAKEKPSLSLERLFQQELAPRLLLLGTERAIGDVDKALSEGRTGLKPPRIVTATGLDVLLVRISEVAHRYDALCFVRGGGEVAGFATWNDKRLIEALFACGKPFYTALGHADDFTLADKYADQAFATPSSFGSACTGAWQARLAGEVVQKHVKELEQAIEKATKASKDERRTTFQRTVDALGAEVSRNRETATGMQALLADLRQATLEARGVFGRLTRKSRFQTWTWFLCVFLLGALAGGFACFYAGIATVDRVEDRAEQASHGQQAACPPPVAAPAPARKRLRE